MNQEPFDGERGVPEQTKQICSGSFQRSEPRWSKLSFEAQDLIQSLLEVQPQQRLLPEEVLEHPWMRGQRTYKPKPTEEAKQNTDEDDGSGSEEERREGGGAGEPKRPEPAAAKSNEGGGGDSGSPETSDAPDGGDTEAEEAEAPGSSDQADAPRAMASGVSAYETDSQYDAPESRDTADDSDAASSVAPMSPARRSKRRDLTVVTADSESGDAVLSSPAPTPRESHATEVDDEDSAWDDDDDE